MHAVCLVLISPEDDLQAAAVLYTLQLISGGSGRAAANGTLGIVVQKLPLWCIVWAADRTFVTFELIGVEKCRKQMCLSNRNMQ